ncbi:hypothetical protein HYU50_01230 [Candidatus Woesearchaeota archaeon]|nr:hypothetical protein [Candidatus Woesearchaeota archaeon]
MGLEKIKEEILHKADAAEREILMEAEAKVRSIKSNAATQLKQLEIEAAKRLEAEMKNLENRENSLANMESRKMLFETRKNIIDKVYGEAYNKVRNMPAKDREGIIKKLIDAAKKEIDVDVVYVNEKDKKYCKDEAKTKVIEADGGIISETKDGNIRVNLTFETLFADLREKTAKEVSETLFG